MSDTNYRLPTADVNAIERLLEVIKNEGQEVGGANINNLAKGDILKIETKSGNIYLLEIVQSGKSHAYVYRHQIRSEKCGYLGEHSISSYDAKDRFAPGIIKIDHGMIAINVETCHNWTTSPIIKIALVKFFKL